GCDGRQNPSGKDLFIVPESFLNTSDCCPKLRDTFCITESNVSGWVAMTSSGARKFSFTTLALIFLLKMRRVVQRQFPVSSHRGNAYLTGASCGWLMAA